MIRKLQNITILLSLLVHEVSVAQIPLIPIWTATHNGALTGLDHSNDLVVDQNSFVYVTGQSFQNSLTGSITTIKYDQNGNTIWTDNYKGVIVTANNEGKDICLGPHGEIYVTGNVAFNDGDFCIIKFNPSGRVWAKSKEPYVFGSAEDYARSIATDGAGNIYLSASITSLGGNLLDLYTLKCDSAGNDIWSVDYSSASGDDYASDLAVTTDGHCFSTTSSFNFWGSATYDSQTLHYDSTGIQQWISSYNCQSPSSNDYPYSIICDDNYNTWVCGAADTGTNTNMLAYKQNQYGTRLWTINYGGNGNSQDTAISIHQLPNNLTAITGKAIEIVNGTPTSVTTTFIVDSGQVLSHLQYFGDSLGAEPTDMVTDNYGNIYISGFYNTSLEGKNGFILVYGLNGNLLYEGTYNGILNSNDAFNKIAIDQSGYIYSTGFTTTVPGNSDYLTMKFGMPGISSTTDQGDNSNILIYPNPTTNDINVSLIGLKFKNIVFEVYDLLGSLVISQNSNSTFNSINCSLLERGTYILKILSEDKTYSKLFQKL